MSPDSEGLKAAPVSVVIPFHDSIGTLPRALCSVLSQTVSPIEIIIVDDCSTPTQAEELDRYLEQLPERAEIRLIRSTSNRGPGHARNMGWDASAGELVAFLDADDAWHPEKLARQLTYFREVPQAALVGGQAAQLPGAPSHGASGEASTSCGVSGRRRVTKWTLAVRNPFHTSSVLVKRSLPWRFPDAYAAEDLHLWATVVLSGSQCLRLQDRLSYRFKEPYGSHGLSGFLIRMEAGELRAFGELAKDFPVGRTWLFVAWTISILKFVRRLLRVSFRSGLQGKVERHEQSGCAHGVLRDGELRRRPVL